MISKETINSVTQRLVKAYNPVAIYLFGSYAWGNPNAGSDLDLLVIIENTNQKPHNRCEIGSEALWDIMVPKDLLVYTTEEFKQRAGDLTTLCHKVQKEGRLLYARA
ncbi:MAG: nucleotidyltransferase domain-containing protein [Candidatus Babeliales bacterium]|jgi:predicted nucleotidyltransferase